MNPDDAADLLAQHSGDVFGRLALGDESITYDHLYQAVSISWIGARETPEGVLSPDNHRIVELLITP